MKVQERDRAGERKLVWGSEIDEGMDEGVSNGNT